MTIVIYLNRSKEINNIGKGAYTSLENVKYGDKFLWSIREFKEEQ